MSINVLTVSGRLGRDSEAKFLTSGSQVLEFSIAVDTGFGDKKTSWWLKCSMFGERGHKLSQYLVKGQLVGVSGEFNPRVWNDKDGAERISLELRVNSVELLGSKSENQSQSAPDRSARPAAKAPTKFVDYSDDIPF